MSRMQLVGFIFAAELGSMPRSITAVHLHKCFQVWPWLGQAFSCILEQGKGSMIFDNLFIFGIFGILGYFWIFASLLGQAFSCLLGKGRDP